MISTKSTMKLYPHCSKVGAKNETQPYIDNVMSGVRGELNDSLVSHRGAGRIKRQFSVMSG